MKRTRPHTAVLAGTFATLLGLLVGLASQAAAEDTLQYNRDILPILAENCFACHGPDSASRKADLRLDRREMAMDATAFVPGKPDESEALRRILSTDGEEMMPPPATEKKLTAAQIETLRRWIAEGAEYQPHWSLIAPKRPAVPAVQQATWPHNPIDNFILARLEQHGLAPAAEADRRTLARRVSLDLTGLPPTPELVEAFVNDRDPAAYENLVDQLLESKAWGEHRARYWLDAARYADTHGIHFDNYRENWAYRDWVIRAFNRNLPFDEFTIDQLAGDLLPNPTLDQQVASGFNRCNITTNEGGIIDEEYLVLYTRDRTETTSQVFLGLTAGCAVCHDHKFDPLTQKEFYELAAFFNNTTQAAKDGNIKDTPPKIVVPSMADRPQWESLNLEIAAAREKIKERKQAARGEFDQWVATATPASLAAYTPTAGLQLQASLSEGKGKLLHMSVGEEPREVTLDKGFTWGPGRDGTKAFTLQGGPPNEAGASLVLPDVGDFEADRGFAVSMWVKLNRRGQTGAILARMDDGHEHRGWDVWLEGDRIGMHVINKWPDDALKVVAQSPLARNVWTHITVAYEGNKQAAGVKVYYNGVPQPTSVAADKLHSTIRTEVPLKIGQRNTSSRLGNLAMQDVCIFDTALTAQDAEQLAKIDQVEDLLAKPAAERKPDETNKLLDWWLATVDAPSRALDAQLKLLEQQETQIKSRGTIALVMNEKQAEPAAFVLFRGEYDERRDAVKASTPEALPKMAAQEPLNRLGLAHWLLQADHPLTARVTVNRYWQAVFGTGLVRTAGDFGVTGERPSHPELLDWLAVEFRESGWDVKRFFKLLVTSSAYRQAATITPDKLEKDGDNRLLSRGPRFRMDGEMLRDYALATSGLLVPTIGGPSVKPYQPDGVWEAVAMIGSNTRNYQRDSGPSLYRRSMYTFWKRSAPPASMDVFNAPSREVCTVRRERTNTPLQALVTLNDIQFVEAARNLAQRALLSSAKDDERLDYIARRLVARPWRAEELPFIQASLADLLAYYQSHADDADKLIHEGESKPDAKLAAAELAGWTMLCNELLNLDEVLNK